LSDTRSTGAVGILKFADDSGAVARRAVEADKGDLRRVQLRLYTVQERGPLRKDERLVALGDRVLERLDQALDFR
jgi:hypothetical protein